MQHEIKSPARGYVRRIAVEAGETIYEGHSLLFVEEANVDVKNVAAEEKVDLDHVRPDLAESWSFAEDGMSMTLNLQKGVKFHNGEPCDAAAIKFSLDRALNPDQKSPTRSKIAATSGLITFPGIIEPRSPIAHQPLATAYGFRG